MKLEVSMPKFKMPEFKGINSLLTHPGLRALAIVLGAILVISAVVFAANFFGKRRGSAVLPARTWEEVTATPQPTPIPLVEEEGTSPASPSPTRGVREPTRTPTPTVEEVTVTPVPAQ